MSPKKGVLRFEEKIKSLIGENIIQYPIDEDFIDNLFSVEEAELSSSFVDQISKSVKKTMEVINFVEKILKNPSKANSIGEYIKCFRKKRNWKIQDICIKTGIEHQNIKEIEDESIDPTLISIPKIVNLIRLLKISFNDAIGLLEKSFKLFKMLEQGIIRESFSRVDKDVVFGEKDTLLDNALKELLLRTDDNTNRQNGYQLPIIFKRKLEKEFSNSE